MQRIPHANVNRLDRKRKVDAYVKQPSSDKKKVFIITKDEDAKDCLTEAGFKYLAQSGETYYFAYDEEKSKKCLDFAEWENINFTDVLTF